MLPGHVRQVQIAMNSNFAESVASVKPVRMVNVKHLYRHNLITRESREKVILTLLLNIF